MIVDIILPVYEEEEGLPIFHQALSAVLAGLSPGYQFRMIYVLDRCRDNSLAVLKGLATRDARVTILHLSRRFGHQMSLIAGLDHKSIPPNNGPRGSSIGSRTGFPRSTFQSARPTSA
jgi:polyisoprenyl-phosphate glycosyltransferase